MITKTDDGQGGTTRLIISQPSMRSPVVKHDPWNAHGWIDYAFVENYLWPDGKVRISCDAVLKDGTGCWYGSKGETYSDDAVDQANLQLGQVGSYPCPGHPTGAYGEGFNALLRPLLVKKRLA